MPRNSGTQEPQLVPDWNATCVPISGDGEIRQSDFGLAHSGAGDPASAALPEVLRETWDLAPSPGNAPRAVAWAARARCGRPLAHNPFCPVPAKLTLT